MHEHEQIERGVPQTPLVVIGQAVPFVMPNSVTTASPPLMRATPSKNSAEDTPATITALREWSISSEYVCPEAAEGCTRSHFCWPAKSYRAAHNRPRS